MAEITRKELILALISAGNHLDLHGANLSGAHLRGANLRGVDLSEAKLIGATMPDGTKHE